MAIDAGHAALSEVNVRFKSFMFAGVLAADTAAMTGGTCSGHGWIRCEIVAIKKSAAHAGGLADMAVAAGCVAASTVIAKHLMHGRIFSIRPPGFQDSPVAGLRGMQAVSLEFDLFLMTF